jgi:hypothetical protein
MQSGEIYLMLDRNKMTIIIEDNLIIYGNFS